MKKLLLCMAMLLFMATPCFAEECDHKLVGEIVRMPTCISEGMVTSNCTKCGELVNVTLPISKTHTFTTKPSTQIISPSPFHEGVFREYCDCGATFKDEYTPKLQAFIELRYPSLTIKRGKKKQQMVYMADGDSVRSWKISNKKVAIIRTKYDGIVKIKGKKKGTSVITVKLKSGKKAKFTVTVK